MPADVAVVEEGELAERSLGQLGDEARAGQALAHLEFACAGQKLFAVSAPPGHERDLLVLEGGDRVHIDGERERRWPWVIVRAGVGNPKTLGVEDGGGVL